MNENEREKGRERESAKTQMRNYIKNHITVPSISHCSGWTLIIHWKAVKPLGFQLLGLLVNMSVSKLVS